MMDDLISRQAAIDAIITLWANKPFGNPALTEIKECVERVPSAQAEVVRCGECVYRRRCMLQHFVESNAVDSTKIDWSEWYCADGVWDINVPRKSEERREKDEVD